MILLISDLHLEEERPDITRAFLDLLNGRARSAQALYILGDFFEAWIGDDGMTPFQRSICQALRELSDSGTQIFIMHGNRDFLIGKAFCKAAGATLLKDPSVVQLAGEPVLLMHGDSLCTRDLGYMKLRRILRNPITLFILRHLPLGTRHKLARKLRSESSAQVRMKANDIVDVTPEEVPRVMQQFGVRPRGLAFAAILVHAERVVRGGFAVRGGFRRVLGFAIVFGFRGGGGGGDGHCEVRGGWVGGER